MRSASDLNRLYTALFLSWLLHAMLLFASFLGMDSPAPEQASKEVADVLIARLAPLGSGAVTPGGPRPAGAKEARANPPRAEKEPFFNADQLTKRPRPKGNVDLDIPEAGLLKSSDALVMRLWIDSLGRVVSIEIQNTDLPKPFTAAVAATFGRARFEPGEMYGRPVGSIMKIEVSLDDQALSSP
jgi:hypothetical protein